MFITGGIIVSAIAVVAAGYLGYKGHLGKGLQGFVGSIVDKFSKLNKNSKISQQTQQSAHNTLSKVQIPIEQLRQDMDKADNLVQEMTLSLGGKTGAILMVDNVKEAIAKEEWSNARFYLSFFLRKNNAVKERLPQLEALCEKNKGLCIFEGDIPFEKRFEKERNDIKNICAGFDIFKQEILKHPELSEFFDKLN